MFINIGTAEVCDARDDAIGIAAGNINSIENSR
jgi:hypothetical protein